MRKIFPNGRDIIINSKVNRFSSDVAQIRVSSLKLKIPEKSCLFTGMIYLNGGNSRLESGSDNPRNKEIGKENISAEIWFGRGLNKISFS